jgi:hypothetical protein
MCPNASHEVPDAFDPPALAFIALRALLRCSMPHEHFLKAMSIILLFMR